MISINNHCHTIYSDGKNTAQEMAMAAKKAGLKILTFTDHFNSPSTELKINFHSVVTNKNLDKYLSELNFLKVTGVKIFKGLEIEYIPGIEKEILSVIDKLDLAMFGVHTFGGFSLDLNEEGFKKCLKIEDGIKGLCKEYYRLVGLAASSGLFNCVAHLDIIKIFNKDLKYFNEDDYYRKCVIDCLNIIKRHDLAIEINTAGFDKQVGVQYPSEWIIHKCIELGIDISIGGDSHSVEQVARYFSKAEKILKNYGCNKIVYFEKRKKYLRNI